MPMVKSPNRVGRQNVTPLSRLGKMGIDRGVAHRPQHTAVVHHVTRLERVDARGHEAGPHKGVARKRDGGEQVVRDLHDARTARIPTESAGTRMYVPARKMCVLEYIATAVCGDVVHQWPLPFTNVPGSSVSERSNSPSSTQQPRWPWLPRRPTAVAAGPRFKKRNRLGRGVTVTRTVMGGCCRSPRSACPSVAVAATYLCAAEMALVTGHLEHPSAVSVTSKMRWNGSRRGRVCSHPKSVSQIRAHVLRTVRGSGGPSRDGCW